MATHYRTKLILDSLNGLIIAIDYGTIHLDLNTHLHHADVKKYVRIICSNYNMIDRDLRVMMVAAALHDIGKIGVLDILMRTREIALEPDSEEMVLIRRHSDIGERMVQTFMTEISADISTTSTILSAIKFHHEWWNGKGYPIGLSKYEIPLSARIVAVADSVSAMIMTERPWRSALTLKEVIKELRDKAGIQFDPDIAITTAEMLEKGKLRIEDF